MSTKSKAAAGLCEWARNIVSYWDVWSTVEPKRQELAQGGVCTKELQARYSLKSL